MSVVRGRRACAVAGTAALALLTGCAGGGPGATTDDRIQVGNAPTPAAGARRSALCGPIRTTVTGAVHADDLTELSGLAASTRAAGRLWAVEDSGAAPTLIGLRPDGTVTTRATVTGATNVDWEDVAAERTRARGPELVVADVGDNAPFRATVQAYRVPEPDPGAGTTAPAVRLDLRYPDGPHDAETVLADPLRDQLVVVTKAVSGARAYSTRLGGATGSRTLRRGPTVPLALATGGSVSRDGATIAIRTYTGFAVWTRRGREPLMRTLGRPPDCLARPLLAREGQGEAIALDRHGRAVRTVPEGGRARLRRYAAG